MLTQSPDDDRSHRPLRTAFIALEITLVISGLTVVLMRSGSGREIHLHEMFENGVGLLLLVTTLLLLFGSPWFFRSLRWVAWLGWFLAATSLLYILLTPE